MLCEAVIRWWFAVRWWYICESKSWWDLGEVITNSWCWSRVRHELVMRFEWHNQDLSWWCFDDLLCEIDTDTDTKIGMFRWVTGSWWYMWFGRLMGCGFAIFRWLTTSWHKVTVSHISSTDMSSWRLNALWFIMRGGGIQMSYYEVMIR